MTNGRFHRRGFPLIAIAGLMLSGCGGDDDGSDVTPPPPPAAGAPAFTSPASVSVAENTVTPIYTVAATDPDGDAVSYSIAEGPDAARFVLTGNALRFRAAPDFDLYADANQDNIYQVVLRASDPSGNASLLALAVTVTNDGEGIAVTRVATGLFRPVGMTALPETGRIAIAQENGQVFELDTRAGTLTELAGIAATKQPGEVRAIRYAFDRQPYGAAIFLLTQSPVNGVLLQAFTRDRPTRYNWWQLAEPANVLAQASLSPADDPAAPGSLLAAIGDPLGDRVGNPSSGYGKLFRIRPGDPYAGASLPRGPVIVVDRIGTGLQAPAGGGVTGGGAGTRAVLADRGARVMQELTVFDFDARPLDFGWPFYEGTSALVANPPAPVTPPGIVYRFGDGVKEGRGIVSGAPGPAGDLDDRYVFGDVAGRIFAIPLDMLSDRRTHGGDAIENRTLDFAPDTGRIDAPVAILAAFGAIFILDSDGEVFRAEAG